jgi:hypothetical protein
MGLNEVSFLSQKSVGRDIVGLDAVQYEPRTVHNTHRFVRGAALNTEKGYKVSQGKISEEDTEREKIT